jgi:hypothetical protein
MLKKLWRIVIDFFAHLAYSLGLKNAAPIRDRASMIGHWREMDSRLSVSAKASDQTAAVATLPLSADAAMFDLAPQNKKQNRHDVSSFGDIIEVDYVEGEFVSKSLRARTTQSTSPWIFASFAALLVSALAFAGLGNFREMEAANTETFSDRMTASTPPATNAAASVSAENVTTPGVAPAPVVVAPVTQQKLMTAATSASNPTAPQSISPHVDEATKTSAAGTTPLDAKTTASAASIATASTQSATADKTGQKSHRINAANDEGLSTAPKYTPPARARHERTRAARTGRASGGGVPDTVVNGLLGGLAGAVVGGPVGLVAGAAVGATAGKAIAHSWGMR